MSLVCSLPRSFHCEVIADDLDPTPTPRRNYCGPYKEFMLPNDRGALLGPGTTRLPLDRHKCAQVLWRFFGDMGDMDANGEAMETLSRIQVHHLMQFKSRYVLQDWSLVDDLVLSTCYRRLSTTLLTLHPTHYAM